MNVMLIKQSVTSTPGKELSITNQKADNLNMPGGKHPGMC
jgi:hypothetical protein